MTRSQESTGTKSNNAPQSPSRTPWAAFILGIPLAAGILSLFYFGPFRETPARRYVSHPVECVEVVMFCCAAAAFATKFRQSRTEKRACLAKLLPDWDGQPVPLSQTNELISQLG